jgi:putative membrane-bound dehydrogenase-like protein
VLNDIGQPSQQIHKLEMSRFRLAVTCCLFATIVAFLPGQPICSAPNPEVIFNGKSFAGWRHDDSHWRIENGALVGEIPAGEKLRRNLFLFWEGELHDFDLRLQFRVSGHPSANSGVQFRCQALPNGGAAGYQADIDNGAVWLGRIYDEHGRALIGERGTEVSIAPNGRRTVKPFRKPESYRALVRKGEWNDYRVKAVGPRIETFINGERACVLTDKQIGQLDFSGKLALQLHSGPGPAKFEFREIRLEKLGKTEPPPPPAARTSRSRAGIAPKGTDGKLHNLGFEKGTLEGWTATGTAWQRQPVKGDTVAPRRPGQASDHVGDYWVGSYEILDDSPKGTLESAPFEVTHPYASFLVGGGPHRETRVDVIDARTRKVLFTASGKQNENLEIAVVDLSRHLGTKIIVLVVDDHSGGWGHVNYDDFRFHAELPADIAIADSPKRVRSNPLLKHLRKNPTDAARKPDARQEAAHRTVSNMYLPEGFRAELIAAEPDVRQPIAFTIDARGRLWVAEAFSYPQRRPEGEGRDRITIFEDADSDGSFETRKVFIEGLNLVSGLEVGYGGVWVGAAPELLFIPDANRDDVPDGDPIVLLDGWGYQDTHETPNSFTWGPDGWLYGNHGVFNTSAVGKPGAPESERVRLYAAVWRYHPLRKTFEVFAHGGSNQWGLDFDEHGELFMTQCRSYWGGGPTTHLVLHGHYWNQANSRHAPFVSGSHPPGAPHLRNFLRASARYGHGEGGAGERGSRALYGGHSHVGTMIYLGDNWPSEYRGHLFTHNLHGHQINQQINERRGSGYETKHAGSDVLFVDDPLYVAVDLDYGPDGAVYIIDWYDRQHCHSPHMERWDRSNGRIYRVSYTETFHPRATNLVAATDLELARLHTHENAWYSRTARRLLHERSAARKIDERAMAELRGLLADKKTTRVLRAMWTLHLLESSGGELPRQLFEHSSEYVRAWAVRLSTEHRPLEFDPFIRLLELAGTDPSPRVRLAIASWLPSASTHVWSVAEALASHSEDRGDANLSRMIWYGIAPHVQSDPVNAFRIADVTGLPSLRDFIWWYAAKSDTGLDHAIGLLAADPSIDSTRHYLELIHFARKGSYSRTTPESWKAISKTLYDHADTAIRGTAERIGALLADEFVLARMRDALESKETPNAERRRAFEILSLASDAKSVPQFLSLLDDKRYRRDVIQLLGRFRHSAVAPALLERFDSLSDEEKRVAVGTLTTRPEYARPFLEAVVAKKVDKASLSSFHVRQLRSLRDERVNALVTRVFGKARDTSADAKARIARHSKTYRDAPLWAYSANAGQKVFEKACATCHSQNAKEGHLGPDLTGAGRNGVDYFLESVLDPNAVVGEDFQLTVIVTRSGSVLSGLVRSETAEGITLRTLTETLVVKKSDVASREKTTDSFMPTGLFDTLSEREIIELLKFLSRR